MLFRNASGISPDGRLATEFGVEGKLFRSAADKDLLELADPPKGPVLSALAQRRRRADPPGRHMMSTPEDN